MVWDHLYEWWSETIYINDGLRPSILVMVWDHLYKWWSETIYITDGLRLSISMMVWDHLYQWWSWTIYSNDGLWGNQTVTQFLVSHVLSAIAVVYMTSQGFHKKSSLHAVRTLGLAQFSECRLNRAECGKASWLGGKFNFVWSFIEFHSKFVLIKLYWLTNTIC